MAAKKPTRMKTKKTTSKAKARRKSSTQSTKSALRGPTPKVWGP